MHSVLCCTAHHLPGTLLEAVDPRVKKTRTSASRVLLHSLPKSLDDLSRAGLRLKLQSLLLPVARRPLQRRCIAATMEGETKTLLDSLSPAMTLSTLAGLSTGVGGLLAVVRRPDNLLLAFLLGTAIGVMSTLGLVDMLVANAIEHGVIPIGCSFAAGFALYLLVSPFLPEVSPDMVMGSHHLKADDVMASDEESSHGRKQPIPPPTVSSDGISGGGPGSAHASLDSAKGIRPRAMGRGTRDVTSGGHQGDEHKQRGGSEPGGGVPGASAASAPYVGLEGRARLLRLGLVMALVLTLHNIPEGVAVAMATMSDTNYGALTALAIAFHNIPEGIVCAAPVFAATGSRWKALALALASGLAEPLGAGASSLLLYRYLTEDRVHLMLAFVGGIMVAVCQVELIPEGKKCHSDRHLLVGILTGAVFMGATLYVGV